MPLSICVYCSSSSAVDDVYRDAARELGRLIAARGHALVYGGASVGLMGDLARAVKDGGGRVLGVIPRRMVEFGLGFADADRLLLTDTMAERKALMIEHANAYVALPGGFGTLEELLEVMTLKQLEYLRGPIVLLNTGGFYDPLLAHFERLYRDRFARPEFRALYHVAPDATDALGYIEGYAEGPLPRKWF
jgi:cytokinin riboside 5'-monophosphate phosphoribohydrolase